MEIVHPTYWIKQYAMYCLKCKEWMASKAPPSHRVNAVKLCVALYIRSILTFLMPYEEH